jgi:outer membrane receptor protein involved in Fe transport
MKAYRFLFLVMAAIMVEWLPAQTDTVPGNALLYGKVTDPADGSPLVGVNVMIKGTSSGTRTDGDGKYTLRVKAGEYNIEYTYIGFETVLVTSVRLKAGEKKELNAQMKEAVATFGQEVVVIGEKPLVDVENPKTMQRIDRTQIEEQPVRQIQSILNTQAGVINSPDGLHIRGGRTYETGFMIDGVSARDPLAGTGFGIDIGANAIEDIDITTGGVGAEYGDATTGVVNTKTRSGGDKTQASFLYKRDNFGFNRSSNAVFNESVFELGIGGPARWISKKIPGKLYYYGSVRGFFSDLYTRNPPRQLVSSLYPASGWTPNADNRWSGMLRLDYHISEQRKISFTYNKTLAVNQDVNMLRVTGNDIPYTPGYQFDFHNQMDNANTFTHDGNLAIINYSDASRRRFAYNLTFSRFFSRLRADANGRDWRPERVENEFDPSSIVVPPVTYYNPGDTIVAVNPPDGLYNNNGVATLWHDHYFEEYSLKYSGNYYSKDALNRLSFGVEVKLQDLQWIDIGRPWIGAPVQLAGGGYSQSYRLGEYSEAWRVKPSRGGAWVSEKIKYKGLIAEVGARFEYWMPGKYVDDAIGNPNAQIREEIREDYKRQTLNILGRGFKFRFLPKISATFPVRENQLLYFNYGHSTILPHPSFIYTGLDPYYSDRSTVSRLGNPNLNPEVSIAYELGLKSQITNNDALNISAFYRDNYDFVTSTSILVKDASGREVSRTLRINSDYARVRGIEATYIKRINKWFSGTVSASYMVATGQSSSASESLKEILSSGNREDTREFDLPWSSPWDIKGNSIFTVNRPVGLWGKKWLNRMSFYLEFVWRSGRRYTPYILTGYEDMNGRPVYVQEPEQTKRWSRVGDPTWWLDFNYKKWWKLGKVNIAWTVEVTNLLNIKNSARINPVTGRAWETGDPVPTEWRDPAYIDPRDARSFGAPPNDPSRYMQQRHFLTGLQVRF